jgi:hypothetical protein
MRRASARPTDHQERGPEPEAAKLVAGFEDDEVVVSLAAYQSIVDDMATRDTEVQA